MQVMPACGPTWSYPAAWLLVQCFSIRHSPAILIGLLLQPFRVDVCYPAPTACPINR
jgi:hypothetical protein